MRLFGACSYYYCFPIIVITLFGDGRTTTSYACLGSDLDYFSTMTHQHHRVDQEQVQQTQPERCGTPGLHLSKQQAEAFRNKMAATQKTIHNKNAGPIMIQVSFHVISDGASGNIPQQHITDQVQVMNDAFAPHNFQFSLRGTVRTDNADLYERCISGDETFKAELRGPNDGLDVLYFYTCELDGFLGYATYPPGLVSNFSPSLPPRDGVVCHSQSLPGGSITNYNLGDTAVHVIGHWLGLLHTFQGGCDGAGDYVDDTPAQGVPTLGCPVTAPDTCPLAPGGDPIENYMDLSDDTCYTTFTVGQSARMQAVWNIYRSGAASAKPIISLTNGVPLGGQSLNAGTWQQYRLTVTSPFDFISVTLSGNNGDADLFVGSCAATSLNDADESCSGVSALFTAEDDGSILIEVYAAATFTSWTITAATLPPTPLLEQLANTDTTTPGLTIGAAGDGFGFVLRNVPPGTLLSVTTEGDNGDADLYIYLGPFTRVCVSGGSDSNESCEGIEIGDTMKDVFIAIVAKNPFQDLTLTVTYNAAPSKTPSAAPSKTPSTTPSLMPTGQQCNIIFSLLAFIVRILTLGLVNLCG